MAYFNHAIIVRQGPGERCALVREENPSSLKPAKVKWLELARHGLPVNRFGFPEWVQLGGDQYRKIALLHPAGLVAVAVPTTFPLRQWYLMVYRVLCWLAVAYSRLIQTAVVWNLAEYEPNVVPSWRQLRWPK